MGLSQTLIGHKILIMKRIILLIAILSYSLGLFAQNRQKQAETAYAKTDYNSAITIYETILKGEGQSADLYYNLGNAYYKADRIANAILNYEKALLLSPGDEDIRHNLDIARAKTIDKITPIGNFLLADWVRSLRMLMTSNNWAKTGIFMFLLFVTSLFIYFFAGRVWMKKVAFFGGILMLLISIFANYAAFEQKQSLLTENSAIIFSSSVVAKSTPDDSGTDLFLMHQGTKVILRDKVGEWSKVELEDGNDGWIQSKSFEVIALRK